MKWFKWALFGILTAGVGFWIYKSYKKILTQIHLLIALLKVTQMDFLPHPHQLHPKNMDKLHKRFNKNKYKPINKLIQTIKNREQNLRLCK